MLQLEMEREIGPALGRGERFSIEDLHLFKIL